ncbi:MAG TPA: helix-turn-helix transcriptional regulator [Candidatus Binatia bacterium]|nr:helix-turn-helix transcriptional regulator [Candidatus Binatia bacterium]
MKLKMTRSSGNVFRDLGFPPHEAEHLLVRADLMIKVQKLITSRGLKQAEVAKILRITQPRVSDLLRGRIDLFSTDALIDMLARLGVRVKLVLKPSRRSRLTSEGRFSCSMRVLSAIASILVTNHLTVFVFATRP